VVGGDFSQVGAMYRLQKSGAYFWRGFFLPPTIIMRLEENFWRRK